MEEEKNLWKARNVKVAEVKVKKERSLQKARNGSIPEIIWGKSKQKKKKEKKMIMESVKKLNLRSFFFW